ncbi:MAG TPA: N-acetylglucosamine-6-phosphate deacetylase [Chloroflexia bacterium]|nr:N-acetylglucosamine-6-phosphate deacetylase [Chloroflexia bacterium]
MLYVKSATIVTPEKLLEDSAVLVEGGRIIAVGSSGEVQCPPGAQQIEGGELLLAPGFIDLQINGAFGEDFTANPGSIWEVASKLPRYGVTAFLPTIITSPPSQVAAAQEVISQGPPSGFIGATPLGLHLEGPFLNRDKHGAHDPTHLRLPDITAIARWSPDEGVRMVTLAPELPGALSVVSALVARGVVVSAGHSMATFEEARAGIEAGISYGTHLFNAMPALEHREPGLVGAMLTDDNVTVGIIADGVHLHPAVVALIWRAKGPAHLNMVTDAMAGLGMPPGVYKLGNEDVTVDERSARLPDGRLAGSVLSLDQAVRNLVEFTGCHAAEAIAVVTSVPASILGLSKSHGRIAPGYVADMTLLTSDLHVVTTIVGGEVVFDRA